MVNATPLGVFPSHLHVLSTNQLPHENDNVYCMCALYLTGSEVLVPGFFPSSFFPPVFGVPTLGCQENR